jgi:hypothetical protein
VHAQVLATRDVTGHSHWRQAMVHELLGIENNRVDLRSTSTKVAKENQELVLSADQDAFFHSQMFNNYGGRYSEGSNMP